MAEIKEQQKIANEVYANRVAHCKKVFDQTGDPRIYSAMKEFQQPAPDINLGQDVGPTL